MTAPALDFDDPTDLADAERGLVGRLEPCVIRDGDGRTVWDVSVFGFLDADCPRTAHPALWRHCRLTRLRGLYEVAEGVYQVRGMDLSNMTIIEGETGVLVIDPLLCRETAAAALALYREHRGDRPVRAVFYSHSHADHFGADSDVLLGSHHWPTYGSERLTAFLELQRDAYAYTHDQSVRLMNRGYTGPEIAEALELPPALAYCWHVQGFYGSHNNNAKAVYQRYMGWFDGNPSRLWQHPPVEQAVRYVAAIGGADAVLEQADVAHRAGDFRWAAELLNHLLFAEPEHPDARELQARTFEQLAYATDNGPWRSFYLTGALELRDGVRKTPLSLAPDLVAALNTEQIFQAMSVRVDGPRAAAARLVIRWCYTDPDERWTLILANGVLVAHRGEGPHGARPQVTITVSRAVHNEILGLRTTFLDQVVAGTVTTEGDANVLLELNDHLEQPEHSFAIRHTLTGARPGRSRPRAMRTYCRS
jgi:alkyl sulfatase BDS1-like metallo-beta-lactamase superfamily hydrolase